jgi:hypothetical protein
MQGFPGKPDDAGRSRAVDRRQAAYFRTLLDRQRMLVEEELGSHLQSLAQHRDSGDLWAIKRLRRAIHAREADRYALERLIAALDDRLRTGQR